MIKQFFILVVMTAVLAGQHSRKTPIMCWRSPEDIAPNYNFILQIIDLNTDLWKYSGPGDFNDMDMRQLGHGMTYEADKKFVFKLEDLGIKAKKRYKVRDLWEHTTSEKIMTESFEYTIPAPAVIALKKSENL